MSKRLSDKVRAALLHRAQSEDWIKGDGHPKLKASGNRLALEFLLGVAAALNLTHHPEKARFASICVTAANEGCDDFLFGDHD